MEHRIIVSAFALALVLAAGCGSTRYRVVASDHDVALGSMLALEPVTHASAAADTSAFDASLAAAVDDATPDHRIAAGLDARHRIFVEVRELRRDGERVFATSAVSIKDRRGNTVDELEIAFDVAADETEAGAELGRRIGYFITHREGHQI